MKSVRCCLIVIALSGLFAGCVTSGAKPKATKEPAPKFEPKDVVRLKDGSRLIGQIQGLTKGKLTLKTGYAGVLVLEMAKVEGLSAERTWNIRIKDSDRILGSLRFDAEKGQEIQRRKAGPRGVGIEQLDAIWALGEDSPETIAVKKKLEAERPKWTFRAEAGVTGETGNSERVSSNARVEIKRTTPTDRLLLYFQGRYSKENGEESEKEFIGGGKLEVDATKSLFVWGRAEFEHDPFEDIDLRSTATGGLGYFAIREKDHELKFRGGVGFRHESFRSGRDSDGRVVGEAAVDYMKEILEWLRFTHHTTYTPSFEEVRDYRISMENAAEIPLTKDEDWKFKIGVRNDYTAVPSPDVDRRLETKYFANLVWEIK